MTDDVVQPCASCGAETAPGSRRFAGRRRAIDRETGDTVILCPVCLETSAAEESELPGAARYAVVEIRGMTS